MSAKGHSSMGRYGAPTAKKKIWHACPARNEPCKVVLETKIGYKHGAIINSSMGIRAYAGSIRK